MKEIITLVLALSLVFTLTACGEDTTTMPTNEGNGTTITPNNTTTTPTPENVIDPSSDNGETPLSDFEYERRNDMGLIGMVIIKYLGNSEQVRIPVEIENEPVIRIESESFEGSSVIDVYVPEGVLGIGYNTFGNCTKLTNITLPDSLMSIGWTAFDGCAALTSATFRGVVYSYDDIDNLYQVINAG
ncbi:MAG: leucine-rich repeat domain-containing protein [Oscillospiraceae bacterium]|nr:leucine-rich repeat domain-containing protein [Oscillospiraceae bacterium]